MLRKYQEIILFICLQALLSEDYSLDSFFCLSVSELDEHLAKHTASAEDSKKLQTYLDFLKSYYGELNALEIGLHYTGSEENLN